MVRLIGNTAASTSSGHEPVGPIRAMPATIRSCTLSQRFHTSSGRLKPAATCCSRAARVPRGSTMMPPPRKLGAR